MTAPTTQAEQGDAVRETAFLRATVQTLSRELGIERRLVNDFEADVARITTERDQLAADLRKAVIQLGEHAAARGEAEGRLRASEMAGVVEGWRERALKAEAEKDRLREAMEDLQGAFLAAADAYAKITAALTPDPKDAGGTAKGDDYGA